VTGSLISFIYYPESGKEKIRSELKRNSGLIYIDAFTPLYRHYHTREEVAGWFATCGFEGVE